MKAIRAELATIDEPLMWIGGQRGDSGFALIVDTTFIGPAALKRIEKMQNVRSSTSSLARSPRARSASWLSDGFEWPCYKPDGAWLGPRERNRPAPFFPTNLSPSMITCPLQMTCDGDPVTARPS